MNNSKVNSERVVSFVGFLFLICAGICSLVLGGQPTSLLEYIVPTALLVPIIHFSCSFIALIMVFKPNYYYMAFILIIESVLTVLTRYETLGIFFFYAAISLIMIKDIFEQKRKPLIIVLTIIHFLSLIGSYPFGIMRAILNIFSSAFFFVFMCWIVELLKAQFSCFIPKNVTKNEVLADLKPGEKLSLSNYNLTDRQKKFVLENIHNNLSYKQISEKYYVSISTVKKEFSEVYKVFCVDKLEELRILLLQYQVEEEKKSRDLRKSLLSPHR